MKRIEKIYLILFFGLMLWMALGSLWANTLVHSYPTGYLASDNHLHYHIAEIILESGGYEYGSMAIHAGNPDVMGHYYSFVSHLAAIITSVSGIPAYDSVLLLAVLMGIFCALIFYFLLRRHNKTVAILSTPISTFLFIRNFYFLFLWGQYSMISGTAFAVLALWAFANRKTKGTFIVMVFAFAASFSSHTSEFLAMIGFMLVYAGALAVLRRDFRTIRSLLTALLVSLLVAFDYSIIFWKVILPYGAGGLFIDLSNPYLEYLRTATLANFNFFAIGLALGIVFYFLSKKYLRITLAFSVYILIWGYLNYFGGVVGSRSLPQRFFWPVYFMPLFGYGLYFVLKKISKKKAFAYGVSIVLIVFAILLFYSRFPSYSLYGQDDFDTFSWIRENTDINSKVLFVYDHFYPQAASFYSTFRNSYFIRDREYIESFNEGVIRRYYEVRLSFERAYRLPYRKSLFSFGFYMDSPDFEGDAIRDICGFDYYVFSKKVPSQGLNMFNHIFELFLLENDFFRTVYSNEGVHVLQNMNKSADCIPEGGVNLGNQG